MRIFVLMKSVSEMNKYLLIVLVLFLAGCDKTIKSPVQEMQPEDTEQTINGQDDNESTASLGENEGNEGQNSSGQQDNVIIMVRMTQSHLNTSS